MKHFFTLLFSIGLLMQLSGQKHQWELGLSLGGSNIAGDLIDPDLSTFKETNFAFGLHASKFLSSELALKLNYYNGRLTGKDANFDRLSARGFSFSSPVHEFSGMIAWEPIGSKRYKEEKFHKIVSPYLTGGIGLAYFNPKTIFNSVNSSMAELVAKDQAKDVSTFRLVIPVGAGLKIDLTDQWVLGFEYGLRVTFSDYLDGVSYAGNPHKNDWYGIGGLNLTYRLHQKKTADTGVVDAQ
ncbi:MAG: DUF6089 family protein [Saprospiraceae bacterium]